MRVLLDVSAVPSEPRGAGRYISELAGHLVRLDVPDLEVLLLARRGDDARWRARDGANARHEVRAVVPGPRPVRLAWEQAAGPRFAGHADVDVWHGPHYTAPLRLRRPTVITVHDLTLIEHPEWHERPKAVFFGRMIPAAVARAAVCVCVSKHTADRLEAVLPTARGAPGVERDDSAPRVREAAGPEVVVIPHGVDHSRFHPVSDARADLTVLDALGVRPPYVGFLGTIEPRKDVVSLVRAFAAVAARHPELRLVLTGGLGWNTGPVHTAIATSGVAHRIVRTGYVPDDVVAPLLRRAEAVVYPSLEEGFGLPALEALACGTPLVTTAGSSIEEFVGDAALLVTPGDVEALAAAMEGALDPAIAARLRSAGPTQAAPFTWEASATAHVRAYRRALALRAG